MNIIVQKISPDHNDSFWYDGRIATAGEYELIAAGEIRVLLEKDGEYVGLYDGKARDGFPEPQNDYDLVPMYGNENGFVMDMNNWFEILRDDETVGDVYGNYDEAIQALKEMEATDVSES